MSLVSVQVRTKIWDDPVFENFPLNTKLLYLYILTGSQRDTVDVFPCSIKKMADNTCLSIDKVKKGIKQLVNAKYIFYTDCSHVIITSPHDQYKRNNKMRQRAKNVLPMYTQHIEILKVFCDQYHEHINDVLTTGNGCVWTHRLHTIHNTQDIKHKTSFNINVANEKNEEKQSKKIYLQDNPPKLEDVIKLATEKAIKSIKEIFRNNKLIVNELEVRSLSLKLHEYYTSTGWKSAKGTKLKDLKKTVSTWMNKEPDDKFVTEKQSNGVCF